MSRATRASATGETDSLVIPRHGVGVWHCITAALGRQQMASNTNARVVPSMGQGIEPFQIMMNAKEVPTAEFADYILCSIDRATNGTSFAIVEWPTPRWIPPAAANGAGSFPSPDIRSSEQITRARALSWTSEARVTRRPRSEAMAR
jgi:hypothetical protein